MALMMIRATLKPESVPETDAGIERLFAALEEAQPAGVRYASLRLPDDVTAVILLDVEDEASNPLAQIPEFVRFQQDLRGWIAAAPEAQPLTVKGSYRLF